jgi:hypothetical protein
MSEEQSENNGSFFTKIFRFIVKGTGFDPDLEKQIQD